MGYKIHSIALQLKSSESNNSNNQSSLEIKVLIENKRHTASHKIPKFQNKKQTSFLQISLEMKWLITPLKLNLLHIPLLLQQKN